MPSMPAAPLQGGFYLAQLLRAASHRVACPVSDNLLLHAAPLRRPAPLGPCLHPRSCRGASVLSFGGHPQAQNIRPPAVHHVLNVVLDILLKLLPAQHTRSLLPGGRSHACCL